MMIIKADNASHAYNIDKTTLASKREVLIDAIAQTDGLIVAYSGGVDSSILAHFARITLADKAKIVIAVSPSLAQHELEAARAQAHRFNWELIEITTAEVDKPEYQRNDEMRCYFCKRTLFETLDELARTWHLKHIAYGANMDDMNDFRPGHKAAREFNVLSPLQTAKLNKEEIRYLAKEAGLPSWDRPQAACLSSRFPTWQPVSVSLLTQVEKAETFLHQLGLRQVRVRHHDTLASIELDHLELKQVLQDTEMQKKIVTALKNIGYQHVTIDLEGYRQGSANSFRKEKH